VFRDATVPHVAHRAADTLRVRVGGRTRGVTAHQGMGGRPHVVDRRASFGGKMRRAVRRALPPSFEADERVSFAVVLRKGSQLVGDVLLKLDPRHDNGKLAYYVGEFPSGAWVRHRGRKGDRALRLRGARTALR
jgi:hypothetical protein